MNATQSITPPNRDAERIVGSALILGGAASSAFAAKTFIATGFAAHLIPIIGSIVGIALMILGSCLFYFSWRRDQADKTPAEIEMGKKEIEVLTEEAPPEEIDFKPLPIEQMELAKEDVGFPMPEYIVSASPEKTPSAESTEESSLDLTTSEKVLTASNLVQWGLIGASLYGAPYSLVMPLSALSGLGSEIATFCTLPKDASWLRKAMSIPVLSRLILNFNPWVSRFMQGLNLYNLAQNSATKLKAAWNGYKNEPIKAVTSGAAHLFNLASGITFAAEREKLINLSPNKIPDCKPKAKGNLDCSNCGMFAVLLYLIGLSDRYEKGKYSGVKVDFEKDGLYYDPKKGENWFEYYFNPVDVQDDQCPYVPEKSFTGHELGDHSSYAERVYGYEQTGVPKERSNELINKYLVLKPEIQSEINQFAETHFKGADHVIGVHYRGTDKSSEARRVPYDEMIENIQSHISSLNLPDPSKVKIFAASDEQGFIQRISDKYPGQVVTSASRRSTDGKPLHFNADSPYQTGKEAIIDSWLLGKFSDALIRTSSNLSKFSSLLLKPGAKHIEVSKRLYQEPTA